MGDLSELNRFSLDGWHVTAIVPDAAFSYWVLLERPAGDVGDVANYTPYQVEAKSERP
jgi:hypothetical protein